LADREVDVTCIQETRWRSSGCRFFGAKGERYKWRIPVQEVDEKGVGDTLCKTTARHVN